VSSNVKSPRVVLSPRQIWIVFGGLMLSSFLSSLDQTVVATALPAIVRDLVTAIELSGVVPAFLLTSTVATGL
jgi:MFS family permease